MKPTYEQLLEALKAERDSLKAILDCHEALDALCSDEVFGETYEEGLRLDVERLESLISKARG